MPTFDWRLGRPRARSFGPVTLCPIQTAHTAAHTEAHLSTSLYLRQISDPDLMEGVYRLLVRTQRHVRAALALEPFAMDDLATTLRTLLGSAKGNNALVLLAGRLGIEEPTLAISEEAKEGKDVEFSFGAMPTESATAIRVVSMTEFLRARVLVVKHGGTAQSVTWRGLVDDYGNTWGAHLSRSVPRYLDRVQLASSQIGSLGPHLLIALAIEVLKAASVQFVSARADFQPLGSSIDIEHYVRGVTVTRLDERSITLSAAFTDIEPPDGTVLLSAPLDNGGVAAITYEGHGRLMLSHMGYTIHLALAEHATPKWVRTARQGGPQAAS